MTVLRTPDGIRKVATTDDAWRDLRQEMSMLIAMDGSHAPRLLNGNDGERWTLQEDMGHALSLTCAAIKGRSPAELYEDCMGLWFALTNRGIRHGDLTPPNLAWVEGRGLCALDFQDSTRLGSGEPTKRDITDAWQLLDTYFGLVDHAEIQLAGGAVCHSHA